MSILPRYYNIDHDSITMKNCNLHEFPNFIFDLPNLSDITTIDLSYNNIEEIPDKIYSLNLKSLYLNNNKIKKFDSILNMKSLKILDLSYNNIKEIPEKIYNISELVRLDVSYNYILFISAKIVLNKKLCISFYSNPIDLHLCSTLKLYQNNIINDVDEKYEQYYLMMLNIVDEYQQKILDNKIKYFDLSYGYPFMSNDTLRFNIEIKELKHIVSVDTLESSDYIDQCLELINIYYPPDIKIALK